MGRKGGIPPIGKRYEKGDPRTGRRKGVQNKATVEVREMAQKLIEDPGYRKALKIRLQVGEAQAVETMLWHYAYGKPKERVEVTVPGGIAVSVNDPRLMTTEEREKEIAALLGEAAAAVLPPVAIEPSEPSPAESPPDDGVT